MQGKIGVARASHLEPLSDMSGFKSATENVGGQVANPSERQRASAYFTGSDDSRPAGKC
jgi:hypothetical protein